MTGASAAADVAIIGLGVIGGSVALRLRERGTAVRCFSTSTSDCEAAGHAGLRVAASVDDAVRDTGLVLIAVPLDQVCAVATQVVGAAPARATVVHAASLQRLDAVRLLPEIAARVIGAHPLAGSHKTGFSAARADLFHEASVYVERRADRRQREDVELFWSMAGARRIEYATATEHDDAMAWMSHLPQLASTALAATLAGSETAPDESALRSPGPGGRDATRLALSSLSMWRPLLDRAPVATSAALAALEVNVRRLRVALEQRDWQTIEELWTAASTWRADVDPGTKA